MTAWGETWEYRSFDAVQGPQPVVDFLNQPSRQANIQALAIAVYPGSVGLFYGVPGTDTYETMTWMARIFNADEGTQAALDFLNEDPRKLDVGFAIASHDGSLTLFYRVNSHGLDLSGGPDQRWTFRNFTADEGLQGAVDFLNEPVAQRYAEAFVVAGNDGSVSLFFLEPGSGYLEGFFPWKFRNFTADEVPQGVLDFFNERSNYVLTGTAFARDDGSVMVLYFDGGSS